MIYTRQIYDLLKGLFITVLYAAFFAVQLFFNFDLSSKKSSFANYTVQQVAAQQNAQHISKYQRSVSAKNNIRLNKRFQPSSIPDCVFPDVAVIIKYKEIELCKFCETSLLNTVTLSSLLRGPPVSA